MNSYLPNFKRFLISFALLFPFYFSAQNVYEWYQDGVIIFQLKTSSFVQIKSKDKNVDFKNSTLLNQFSDKYQINKVTQLFPRHQNELLANTFQIEFDKILEVEDFITELSDIPSVEYAEKKELHVSFLTPNDQYFNNSTNNGQRALFQINAPQAWDLSTGLASVVVAVTDNAININHPDLVNKCVQGYDAVDNDNDPTGCGSNTGFHGSHVSGIVGAETNNGSGVASIGFDVSIMPIKIGNCNGSLTAGYEGIVWAADNGAEVVNMSWGGGGQSNYGQNVCTYAWNAGTIPVAAAGNDGVNSVFYPAGYNNVISVASSTVGDAKSSFSNYGSWIDITAPGSSILSCNSGSGYQVTQGTSMASPMVAGLLGLMKSYAPNATNTDLVNCMYSSAENIDGSNGNYVGQLGAGRIDAYQALVCLNAFSFTLDAAVSAVNSPDGTVCGSSVDPEVVIRNFGSSTLTSLTINYQISGSGLQTYNWTGSLASGQTEAVALPNQALADGSYTFTASSSNPNGATDQNPANDQLSTSFSVASTGQNVDVTIITDCFGSEVSWTISDAAGNEMASGGPYTDVTGGQTNSSPVCLVPSCYDFTINDTYGDGMYGSQWNSCSVDGDYFINDANGTTILQMTAANADFGSSTTDNFCVTSLNIDDDASVQQINQPNGTTCSSSVDPEVQIINFGNQPLTSVDINYQLSGNALLTYAWSGNLSSGQSTTITLPTLTLSSGAQTFSVYTSNPNGNADQNTTNDSLQTSVNVYTSSLPLPFSESFESNSLTTNAWNLENPDNSETWEIVTVAGTTPGDKAAKLDFFQYSQLGQRDALITSPLNFNGYTSLDLSFEHAYRRYDQNSTDSLIVSISTDCGATYTRLLELAEDGTGSFATAYTSTTSFTPTQTSDWCMGTVGSDCFTVNLDNYLGNSNVLVKFESYNAGTNGNNLFIDNINIDGTANTAPPTADFNANSTNICEGVTVQFNDLSFTGVTSWSWDFGDGNTSSNQNPSHTYTSSGTYTVSLTVTNSVGSDTYTLNDYITVSISDDATISPISPLCVSDPSTSLSAATSGGSWTGNGVNSNGLFNPSSAGVGTHTITYTTVGACPDTSSIDIVVTNQADATISPVSSLCFSGSPINLSAATPGGTWSGTGITDPTNGVFDPAVAGVGTYTISYTITGNCGNTATTSINVTNALDATINSVGPFCANESPVTLSAASPGGVWSGTGITDPINGTFDPSVAGTGSFTVTYTISGSCGSSSTTVIDITGALDASINPAGPFCSNDSPTVLSSVNPGGSWTGNGITNSATGQFDPSVAGPGVHTITYVIMGACGDFSTIQITVEESQANFTLPTDSTCTNDSPLQLSGSPLGGLWSGSGVNSSGIFDPSAAGPGTHSITYTITGFCPDSYAQSIVVQENVTASIAYVDNLCSTASSVQLNGTPSGGAWSGTGVNSNGIFDPFIAGVGSHIVNYVVDGLCGDETSTVIVVDDCSSISENSVLSISVIPNPNNGEFILSIEGGNTNDIVLEIYSQLGKVVYSEQLDQNSSTEDKSLKLSHLADGIYIIKVGSVTKKFIKM